MKHRAIKRLLSYGTNYKRLAIQGSVFSLLNKLFDVAPEILIGIAIDVVVRRGDSFLSVFGIRQLEHQVVTLAGLTALIWISESVFEYLYQLRWQGLAQLVQHQLRVDVYSQLQERDFSFFDKQTSGALTATLNDDINQLERFLGTGANALIQVFGAVLFIGSVFLMIAPDIAAVAFAPIPVIFWGASKYRSLAEPLYADVRSKAASIGGSLQTNISGIATIKAYVAEAYERLRITRVSQDYVDANQKAIRVNSAFTPIIRVAILIGFVSTLVFGAFKALDGGIAVGSFGMLVFLTQRLLWPFTTLSQTIDQYQRAMASCDRVLDLIDPSKALPANKTSSSCTRSFKTFSQRGPLSVSFEAVSFSYIESHKVLNKLSLKFAAGQTTAIVGPTGSGKSTIAKLLLRFYEPQAGAVFIESTDIKDMSKHDLRSLFGFVSQDVYLFSGSIRENICYPGLDVSPESFAEVCHLTAVDEFVEKLPNRYETLIGENGLTLSGGQRQRIGLARALIRNPRILILDEATSAVDNETERLIQESMQKIRENRTVIVIAHRLSTVEKADKIYVLQSGICAEEGTHEDLLKNKGLYEKLWRKI